MKIEDAIAALRDGSHIYASFFLGRTGFETAARDACAKYGLGEQTDKIVEMLLPHKAIINLYGHSTATHGVWQPAEGYHEIIPIDEAVRRIRYWIENGEI